MLYAPTGRPLSAFGAEIPTPPGFQWPTEADYAADLIKAVHAMVPDIGSSPLSGIISLPIQTQVTGLVGTLEAAADKPMGALFDLSNNIQMLTQAQTPAQIVNAVNDVFQSAVDITAMTLEALDVASSIVEVVPIVGQIVGAVFGIISALLALPSRDTLQKECNEKLSKELAASCKRQWDEASRVAPTGWIHGGNELNASPADWFRGLAYRRWQGSKEYPPSLPTMFLMLCGGAAGDFGISESKYQAIVSSIRKGKIKVGNITQDIPKNPHVGMPLNTRKKIWLLMQAAMSCVQDPNAQRPQSLGDNGRAAMSMLAEIFRVASDYDGTRGKKQIDNELLRQLGNEAFAWTARKRICSPATPFTKEIAAYDSCRQEWVGTYGVIPGLPGTRFREGGVVAQFNRMVREFNTVLYNMFGVGSGAGRRLMPRPVGAKPAPKPVLSDPRLGLIAKLSPSARAALTFSPNAVKTMSDLESKIDAASRGDHQKAALWTTAVVLGGGAFILARRVAKRT